MAGGSTVAYIATTKTDCLFGKKLPAKFPILNSPPVELTLVSGLPRGCFVMPFPPWAPLSGSLAPLSNPFPVLIAVLPTLISMGFSYLLPQALSGGT